MQEAARSLDVDARGAVYVGTDISLTVLAYAARRNQGGAFAVARVPRLPFQDHSFHKALVVNVCHHLSDTEVDGLCAELARLVRGPIVLVDADPETSNWFQRLLLSLDPGQNFCGRDHRVRQISRTLVVTGHRSFSTPTHSVSLYLIEATA